MNSFNWALTTNDTIGNEDTLARIKIEGLLTSEAFQKARLCATKLHAHLPKIFAKPEIREMLDVAWCDNIENIRRCLGGNTWSLKRPVVVFIDETLIGSDVEFIRHIGKTYAFNLPFDSEYYESLIAQRYQQFMEKSGRKHVYFTFAIDHKTIGSFIIMLYTDLVPRTCQHFWKLCTGYRSKNAWGTILRYVNTRVHRIVKNAWLQIGDILESNESLDETVINELTINDENYCIPHDRRGVISMANDGKHSNRDQFVVSLKPNEWMNGYYVAFGQLVDGANTLKIIENISTFYEAPLKRIMITECGECSFDIEKMTKVKIENEVGESEQNYENDDDPNMPDDKSNFTDIIDEHDVASLMRMERYQEGLYSLSNDNLPDLQEASDKEQLRTVRQVRY